MNANHNSNAQIERLEAPACEDFKAKYIMRNKPVIITGVSTKWRAFSEWTPEYLKSIAGDSVITAHFNENANFHEWYTRQDERIDRKVKLAELLDALVPSGGGGSRTRVSI